jgi:anti-anti-sigma factor
MRVFLSWSGKKSRNAANALKPWLEKVLDGTQVWMSDHDIEAGVPWGTSLHEQLGHTDFGILCLTPENLTSPWVLYEAGALAISAKAGCVVPYLLGVAPNALTPPLSLFQSVEAGRDGTWKILRSMNQAREGRVEEGPLREIFLQEWPRLAGQLGLGILTEMHGDILVLAPGPNHLQDDTETRALRELMWARIRGGQRRLVLDLSQVKSATSSGLSFIFVILAAGRRGEAEVAISNVAPQLRELMEMIGVLKMLPLFPTLQEALAHLAGTPKQPEAGEEGPLPRGG